MKTTAGDFTIVRTKTEKGDRKHLVKVLSSDGSTFEGVVAKDAHIAKLRTTATFESKSVLLNLGSDPLPGKVYGLDTTDMYRLKKEHAEFGMIYFFYKPEKKIAMDLFAAFDRVHTILKTTGLEFLLDGLIWEIYPFTGQKYAGMYKVSRNPKAKEGADPMIRRILINPEIMPASEYAYVILHELGHHMHARFATGKKLNATWVRLFNSSIKLATVTKDDSKRLLAGLLNQQDPPSAYRGQLDEDDQLAYKWVLRTIQAQSAISVKELDLLFESDMQDDIKLLWPMRSLGRKDLKPVISEYACKNYRETFAESFAYYMLKRMRKSLPASVIKLTEKTISYAKANRSKDAEEYS